MSLARRIVVWALALILALYVVGTLRLVLSLVSAHGGGQPLMAMIAGLYARFLVMAILLIVLVRLRHNPAASVSGPGADASGNSQIQKSDPR
ncbi:MAG TPA: hypothetical protein VLY23_18110 [Candidatus Acidoferrum sp.]|nr:hypothetical protein [Candidatus Acidoferrum sp.]